jgi:hypothetical protein
MNWFKENLRKRKKNPFYEKIEKLLHKDGFDNDITEVYLIGGCVYSSENYEQAQLSIKQNTLNNLLDTIEYDTQRDNMEFYLINYKSDVPKLIILYDPFELYELEYILKVFSCHEALNTAGLSIEKIN